MKNAIAFLAFFWAFLASSAQESAEYHFDGTGGKFNAALVTESGSEPDATWSANFVPGGSEPAYVSGTINLRLGSRTKPFKTATFACSALFRQVSKVAVSMQADVKNAIEASVFVGETQLGETRQLTSTSSFTDYAFTSDTPLDGTLRIVLEVTSPDASDGRMYVQGVTVAAATAGLSVRPPSFSAEGGVYDRPFDLELSAAEGTSIRYTTDGSQPVVASPLYADPIPLGYGTTTVRAVAIDAEGNMSAEASQTYSIVKEITLVPATMSDIARGGTFFMASSTDAATADFARKFNKTLIETGPGADTKGAFSISKNSDGSYALTLDDMPVGVAASGTNLNNSAEYNHWSISATAEEGRFSIQNKREGNDQKYLAFSIQSEDKDMKYYSASYLNGPYYCHPVILKVAEAEIASVSISGSGYSTFYSDRGVILPQGVSASTISQSAALGEEAYALDYPWEYAEGDVLPALTAVMLKGDAGTYDFAYTDETGRMPESNLLHGTIDDRDISEPAGEYYYYKLAYKSAAERIVGFWWGAPDGGPFRNSGGKAYLAIPKDKAPAATRGFAIDNTTSAIRPAVAETNGATEVYAVTGVLVRRAASRKEALQSLPAGIYVVNGEKALVK